MSTRTIVRRPVIKATLNGVPLTGASQPLSAQCALGWDQRTSTAVIRIPQLPVYNSPPALMRTIVELYMDAPLVPTGQTFMAPEATTLRFKGYLVELDYSLFPRSIDLICRGPLVLAEQFSYDGGLGGTGMDLARGSLGDTDENMVRNVLQYVGLTVPGVTGATPSPDFEVHIGKVDGTHPDTYADSGTGQTLGTTNGPQFVWAVGEKAIAYIERMDEVSVPDLPQTGVPVALGYRTYETRLGTVIRTKISSKGASSLKAVFTEGVDIASASGQQLALQIFNRISVTGFTPAVTAALPKNYTAQASSALLPPGAYISQNVSSPMIERSLIADPGTGISCEAAAKYKLDQYNRELYKYTLTTYRDDALAPGQTIGINDQDTSAMRPRLFGQDADYQTSYYIQNVSTAISESAEFSQTLIVLGGPGGGTSAGPPPGIDFTMALEVELAIVAGVETLLYTVACTAADNTGNAAVSGYTWSTTTGIPASGNGKTFITTFITLNLASITLAITDANGLTGAMTHVPPPSTGTNYLVRRLYLAGTTSIDDFGAGAGWHVDTYAPVLVGAATVVGNAPLWSGPGLALAATDDLVAGSASPTAYNPGVGTLTAIWVETSTDPAVWLMGGAGGQIAMTVDGGAHFIIVAGPRATPILRLLKNTKVYNQFFCLVAAGLFVSNDGMHSWQAALPAAGSEVAADWARSPQRALVAFDSGRLLVDHLGNAQTMPTVVPPVNCLVAVLCMHGSDRFFCVDSVQRTFGHAADGDTALVQMADLPAPALPRSIVQDGDKAGLFYIASGASGAYKSIDAFATTGGYFQIRKPGVGSSPAGAVYTQIGADGRLMASPMTAPASPIVVVSAAGQGVVLGPGTIPSGWQMMGASESGWPAAIQNTNQLGTPLGGAQFISYTLSTSLSGGEIWLHRRHFTLPAGAPHSASLTVGADDEILEVWINGVFLYGGTTLGLLSPMTIPVGYLVASDNVLAIKAKNLAATPPNVTSVEYVLTVT